MPKNTLRSLLLCRRAAPFTQLEHVFADLHLAKRLLTLSAATLPRIRPSFNGPARYALKEIGNVFRTVVALGPGRNLAAALFTYGA